MGSHIFTIAIYRGRYCDSGRKLGIVTAVPIVLGSILRIPFGYYANVFGARLIFLVSFIFFVIPSGLLHKCSATTYARF